MPEFTRTATHPDYEASIYVEFDETFDVTVSDFFDEMDTDEKQEMADLLEADGYMSGKEYTTDDWEDFWGALPLEDRAKLVAHIRDDSYDDLLPEYIVPDAYDYWSKGSAVVKDRLRVHIADHYGLIPKPVEDNIRLPTLASKLLDAVFALPDDELFGLPDSYLSTLKARIESVPAPEQRATTSTDPVLRQILASLEPGQPIDPSLLKEMRLLAGSTSNA